MKAPVGPPICTELPPKADDESAYDGCDQAYGRAYSGCYGECYGERKRHDAHNYAGHEVVLES